MKRKSNSKKLVKVVFRKFGTDAEIQSRLSNVFKMVIEETIKNVKEKPSFISDDLFNKLKNKND